MKVGFVSLGCSKNLIDTEIAIGHFKINNYELENNPEKKQNIKCSMSIRIYLNTLKQAYDAILNTGIEAKYNEIDKGDYMEVVVKIPKK